MLTLHTKIDSATEVAAQLVLAYHQREKCRLRARLDNGEEVALFTVRGTVLRGGDLLKGDDGRVVRIVAALEPTLVVHCDDAHTLARCAFHLGNRHTQVEIGDGFLRILVDPVLKEMVLGLGARVSEEDAAFEPESGAYSAGPHSHRDAGHLLAPVPVRQKIHRPSDPRPA
ncbi:MAG: urease accessory protein UreE [Massilia sp.]